jgi:dienelactone hydrolase
MWIALVLVLVRTSAQGATPEWVEGEWVGGFDGADGAVFIAARFTRDAEADKKVRGEIDLPLRNEVAIGLERVSVRGDTVSFEVPGSGGNLLFEGRHKPQARISGSVRQAFASTHFELMKLVPLAVETIDALSGNYELSSGKVVAITRGPNGPMYLDCQSGRVGTLYSVGETTLVSGDSVLAGYPVELTVTFERDPSGAIDRIRWHSRGQQPVVGTRRLFYRTHQVGYPSGTLRLSATLVVPVGPGPHPAVVLAHGSGPATRDSLRHYADIYARNGIAALIHDKRGTGSSMGDWTRATFDDLAADALASVQFLKTRPEIKARQIGLHGTSYGGWVAPLAASRSPDVAFVIVESAPTSTPLEHERLRVEHQLRADGFSLETVSRALAFMEQKFEVARTATGWEKLTKGVERAAREGWLSYINAPSSLESLQWHWKNILSYDPMPALERLQCPVLVLYGALDTTVPTSHHRARMEAALKRSRSRDATVRVFEKANHGFFEAITGGRREQGSLKGFVPGYLNAHVEWLSARVDIDAGEDSVLSASAGRSAETPSERVIDLLPARRSIQLPAASIRPGALP